MQTPIFALVTDINVNKMDAEDEEIEYLGSQVHYIDDQRRCFSPSASVWKSFGI